MTRRLRAMLWILVTMAGTLVAALAWLCATSAGLERLLALAARAPGVTLAWTSVNGTLAGGFDIDRLVLEHERVRVECERLHGRLDPIALAVLRVRLSELQAARVGVVVKPRRHPPDASPLLFLPPGLGISAVRLQVGVLEIRAPAGGTLLLHDLAATIGVRRSYIEASNLRVAGDGWDIAGRAQLVGGGPPGLDADVDFAWRAGTGRGAAHLAGRGTLAALAVAARSTAPAGVTVTGTADLLQGPAVDLRIVARDAALAAFGAPARGGRLSAVLQASGTPGRFRVAGSLDTSLLPATPLDLTAAGGYAQGALTLEALAVSTATAEGRALVEVHGTLPLGNAPLAVAGSWSGLRWPLRSRSAAVASAAGQFRVDGAGPWSWQASGTVSGGRVPPLAVDGRGQLDGRGVAVERLDAALGAGRASLTGQFAFDAARAWSVTLRGRRLDPGLLRPALAGRVDLAVEAEGRGFEPLGHWSARLSQLAGTVHGLPARGSGRVAAADGAIRFNDLDVAFGSATLQASGALAANSDLRWRLRVDRLGDFVTGGAGSLRSRGALSGDLRHLVARGTIGARGLRFGDWHADQLTVDADLDASDRQPSFLRVLLRRPGHGDLNADQLRVTLDGRASAHTLSLRALRGADSAELIARGHYQEGRWQADIDTLGTAGTALWSYRLAAPARLSVARDAASLSPACFVQQAARLCLHGDWAGTRPWSAGLEASGLPLRLFAVQLPAGADYDGTVGAELTLRGAPGRRWTGEAAAELAGAEFRFRAPSGRLQSVRVGNGRIEGRATADRYTASVGVATEAGSYVTGSFHAARGDGALGAAPVAGALQLSTAELAAVPLFIPGVDRTTGVLSGELAVAGTVGAPLLSGTLRLAGGEIDFYRTHLLLRAVEATVGLDGDALTLQASAATRGGSAVANGRFAWRDRAPSGTLSFRGERLLVADLPEATVTASPQLQFTLDGARITVRGTVTVPSARLAPRDLRQAVVASRDERLADVPAPAAGAATRLDAAVRLELGDDVKVDAYGLKARLGGGLLVSARGDEIASGSGELFVREGKYTAYTRELDIDRGRLLFAGQSLGNPGLDIRAQRKLPAVTAGINVRGTLLEPQISFYSEPAFSQSQIAAILIVGKTLDDIQDADKSTIGGADTRNALIAQGSALLAGQLGRYVGISDVGVEQGTNNATSVVIGRFLSPRLYVGYGVSLTQAINTLKLRYTVGDRWVLRTESGSTQSVDVEYTIEH